jgi:hypothetical protein
MLSDVGHVYFTSLKVLVKNSVFSCFIFGSIGDDDDHNDLSMALEVIITLLDGGYF